MPATLLSRRRINIDNVGDEYGGQVTVSSGGDILATWAPLSRRVRVLDDDGDPVSTEFGTGSLTSPAAWIDADEFAVLSDLGTGINIQRYDRTGAPVGGPIAVAPSADTADDLAMLASGNVLATYRVGNQIRGQILDSALTPSGAEFLLYNVGTGVVRDTIVTPLTGGGFVFTIEFQPFLGPPVDCIRVFDAGGTMTGHVLGFIRTPDVDALPDGGFVVASDSNLRLYNADGSLRIQASSDGDENSQVTVLGTELILLTGDFMAAGKYRHLYSLYDMDGRALTSTELLVISDGSDFDVDGTGEASFVTIEHTKIDGAGANQDVVVSFWELDNILFGGAGDDVLSAVGPVQILIGREGNDVFYIDTQGDQIVERAGQGSADRVLTSASYGMPRGLAVEILSTTDNLGTAAINLTGNPFSQYIYGNAGANILASFFTGGPSLSGDVLTGFEGDDRYIVTHADDQVREEAEGGLDRVLTAVSWVMTAGQHIELLSTSENLTTTAVALTGNAFSQYIYGNAGANVLHGGGGGDVMTGFGNDDLYHVVDAADQVRENAGGGTDRVLASVDWVAGAGQAIELIETIEAAAATPLYLVGNEIGGQTMRGNAGNNTLDGGGGGDTLFGFAGDDTFFVLHQDDLVREFAAGGFDRLFSHIGFALGDEEIEILAAIDPLADTAIDLTGNGFAQYLYGNAGVNRLNGNGGGDVLTGYGGDDLYDITDAGDQIRELAGGGADRLFARVSYTLNNDARVEILGTIDNLATTAIDLIGNAFAQHVYGNAGSNTLGGGAGRDVLDGLGGSDSFLFSQSLNTGFTASFDTLGETANVDRIDNFGADDKILLQSFLFGFAPGALPAGAFNTGTTASQADDRILWDSASQALLFDVDGTGSAAALLIAFISNPFSLDSTYIAVI